METPDIIYLIDCGDEITWCDDPNPSGDLEPDDVVMYEKSSVKSSAHALLKALEEITLRFKTVCDILELDWSEYPEIAKSDNVIKQARG